MQDYRRRMRSALLHSGSLPLLVLQRTIAGQLEQVHFELGVVVGDGIGSALFEYAAGATDDQLAALEQELRYLFALDLGAAVVLGQLLDGLEYLVVVWHFGLGAHFFDGAAMAGAEGVDAVQGLHVEVIGNGHLDDRVAIGCVCVEGGVPPISRYSLMVLASQIGVWTVWPSMITPSLVLSSMARLCASLVKQNSIFSSSAKNWFISQ